MAISQSSNNPVYYVQYAHARICSVLRKLEEERKAAAAPAPEPEAPTTKICPFCKSEIAIDATRCPHCTSELPHKEL